MKRKIKLFIAAAAPLAIALIAAACGSSAAARLGVLPASERAPPRRPTRRGELVARPNRRRRHGTHPLSLRKGQESSQRLLRGLRAVLAAAAQPRQAHARAGAKQSLVGTTRRRNGSTQATYAGHPLYRYLGDTRPGQTNGAGLQDFGGGWDPISPSGKKVESGG